MPEIAEVYRAADYIRQHLVGRTLAVVKAQHDENVFGKVGTSGAEIEKALTGKKIVGAGQQGKYFWISMASPPHLLCHFGMAGWFHIRNIPTFYYKDTKKDKAADKEWPPKHWKFTLETKPEGKDKTVLEAALVDFRRFARVRLIDCAADDIRKMSPLVENGPDPNTDKEILTRDWLAGLCRRKHAPIKAVLLDQANISGIGNWVGDEVLFQARIHPEQYSHTLSDDQITELHKQLMEVVRIAIETKSDSDQFPENWLFKHRWGKGRKAVHEMANGDKITFLTVGGRTSAIVPTLQKKTGPVAGDLNAKASKASKASNGKANGMKGKRKRKNVDEEEDKDDGEEDRVEVADDDVVQAPKSKRSRQARSSKAKASITTTEKSPTTTTKKSFTIENQPQASQENHIRDSKLELDQLPPTAPAEDLAAVSSENKPSRRGRKSNTKLPPTKSTEETQQVVDESNVNHQPGETSTVLPTSIEDSKADGPVKRAKRARLNTKSEVVQAPAKEDSGRRRSGRLGKA